MLFTSSIINDASGSLGGNVFLKTKGGLAIRAKNGQTNPNSNLQNKVRAKLADLTQSWKDLDEDVQQGWRDITPDWPYTNGVGQTKTYSGYALFMKLNGIVFAKGGPDAANGTIIDPPSGKPVLSSVGASISVSQGVGVLAELEVPWTVAGLATEALVVRATPPLSPGITNPSRSSYRWLGQVTDLTIPATLDLLSAYIAKYPTFTEGQKIGIIVELLDTNTGLSTITEQLLKKPE